MINTLKKMVIAMSFVATVTVLVGATDTFAACDKKVPDFDDVREAMAQHQAEVFEAQREGIKAVEERTDWLTETTKGYGENFRYIRKALIDTFEESNGRDRETIDKAIAYQHWGNHLNENVYNFERSYKTKADFIKAVENMSVEDIDKILNYKNDPYYSED